MADAPSIAIVIVSYNVCTELDACLRSLVGQTDPYPATITVVDNASTDGTPQMLRERWPGVTVIAAGANVGFARGNNLGIRATQSDFVWLLNPDTSVPPGALRTLVEALARRPDAAAAGARLVDGDGRPELSFGWTISPTGELFQKLLLALYRRRVEPIVRRVERWTREAGERHWISGACMLVRRSDLDAVGLLDERFFMYTEDVDLCVSLRRRGRKILFVPDAEVRHLRGRSAAVNPATERLRRQSQLAYYRKHHPQWVPVLHAYLKITGKDMARSTD